MSTMEEQFDAWSLSRRPELVTLTEQLRSAMQESPRDVAIAFAEHLFATKEQSSDPNLRRAEFRLRAGVEFFEQDRLAIVAELDRLRDSNALPCNWASDKAVSAMCAILAGGSRERVVIEVMQKLKTDLLEGPPALPRQESANEADKEGK